VANNRGDFRPPNINFASIRIAGVPGLAMFVMVIAIAVAIPAIGWLLTAAIVSGITLGLFLILRRRL